MAVSVGFSLPQSAGTVPLLFRCKVLVGPVHEGLGNENGIQPVGESYNVAFILFHTSVTPHHHIHLYQTHQAFGEFRQTPALCKAKVVEVQIVTWNDDGNYPGIFVKMPFVQTDIHIFVGYRLENISVDRRIPASCIPSPAETLNWEGVNAPTPLVKGWAFRSFISSLEKVLLFPAKLPRVLIFW